MWKNESVSLIPSPEKLQELLLYQFLVFRLFNIVFMNLQIALYFVLGFSWSNNSPLLPFGHYSFLSTVLDLLLLLYVALENLKHIKIYTDIDSQSSRRRHILTLIYFITHVSQTSGKQRHNNSQGRREWDSSACDFSFIPEHRMQLTAWKFTLSSSELRKLPAGWEVKRPP